MPKIGKSIKVGVEVVLLYLEKKEVNHRYQIIHL